MNTSKHSNPVWIFLIIVFCGSLALSQSEKPTFELEEVQTDIENPIAVIPVTKFEDDESLVRYIVRTDDRLLFVDENFNIIRTRQIQPGRETNLDLSKQCKYLLLYEVLSYPKKGVDGKEKITLIDYNGMEYWSKEIVLIWDSRGYTKRFISDDNGNVIEFVCKDVLLVRVITPSGEEKNTTKLFDDIDKWDESGPYCDITTSGEYIAILVDKYLPLDEAILKRVPLRGPNKGKEIVKHREFQDGEPHVFLFNSDGVLLNKRKCEKEKAGNVVITDGDSPLIIVTTTNVDYQKNPNEYSKTNVLNKNLDFLYSLPTCPHKYCVINGSIVIGHKDKINKEPILSAFDISNGEKQWTAPLERDPIFIYKGDGEDNNIIHTISATTPTFNDPIEKFSHSSYNSKGSKISDDFSDVEMNYNNFGYKSKKILWKKSSYLFNKKIYRNKK